MTSIRGNSLENKISIESPLGKAILGHKEGDRIWVKISDSAGYYIVIRHIRKIQMTQKTPLKVSDILHKI